MILDPVPATFREIEDLGSGAVFPKVATKHETALCLFCAEWHGRQDVYWLAKAGMTGTCVDKNGKHLDEMRAVYPDGWEFVEADVFEYAESTERTWDVLTLDPWTGQFSQCADLLPLWCSLANKLVVLGYGTYRLSDPEAPAGWSMTDKIKRSDFKGGIYWLVFERDA